MRREEKKMRGSEKKAMKYDVRRKEGRDETKRDRDEKGNGTRK